MSCTRHMLKFGSIGFKTTSDIFITREKISSIERAFYRKIKLLTVNFKSTKSWCLLHTNKTCTKLSLESRMGKGKGSVYTQGVFVKPGSIIYELQNIKFQDAVELCTFMKKQIYANLVLIKQK